MPFEGSAIARSYSAEFIHAARQRSRSLTSQQSAGGPVSPGIQSIEVEPVYDAPTIPAPVGAVSRFDEEYDKQLRMKAPLSPRSRNRTMSGLSGVSRRGNAFISHTIAEEEAQQAALDSDSSHTVAEERDVERGELSEEEPRLFIAPGTIPKVIDPTPEQTEKSTEKSTEQGKTPEKQTSGQPPQKQNSQQEKAKDPFLVTLEGREHLNPHTWNETYRWFLTGLAGLFVLNATFASSAPSQLIPSIMAYFEVSREVGTLTVALFVAGYCVGPLIWGPLSERYGRKIVFIVAFIPYVGFQAGAALSPNIGALLVFRFLGGCFAASPLTNSGGLIADLWDANKRGIALAIFSLAPFAGPAIAPIVAGALAVTDTNWRWIFWILTIFAGVCLVAIVFLLPETYVPYILHKEAKRLRKETGDSRWHSPTEHPDHKVSFSETLHHTVLKPFIMLVQEPMLFALTLYLSFVYGIVYLLFSAVPLVFQQNHGWNSLVGGLAFLGLPIGGTVATLIYALYFNKQYMAKHRARKGKMVPPEERLKPLMVAAPAFAVAFFWLGWTAYPSINPVSPLLAVGLIGLCILWMFLSIFNYLIDAYLVNAASALAANTVMRSAFGAGFPLFAGQMYDRLGIPGASSLLGGLAIVFIPVPFILYKYGKKIRHMSKNAMVID